MDIEVEKKKKHEKTLRQLALPRNKPNRTNWWIHRSLLVFMSWRAPETKSQDDNDEVTIASSESMYLQSIKLNYKQIIVTVCWKLVINLSLVL